MEKPGISLDDLLFQAFPSHSSNDYNKLPQEEEEATTVAVNADSTNSEVNNRLGEESQTVEIRDSTCLRVGEKVRAFYEMKCDSESLYLYMVYLGFPVLQTQ